jgi:hypothetical protein
MITSTHPKALPESRADDGTDVGNRPADTGDFDGPTALDAGLVAIGGALLIWGVVAEKAALAWFGGVLLVLGGVLPIRLVAQHVRHRLAHRERPARLALGVPAQRRAQSSSQPLTRG